MREPALVSAHGIDPCGAGAQIALPEAVQRHDRLLINRLDRHTTQVAVSGRFEQSLGVGPIGFVAVAVLGDIAWVKQTELMTQSLQLAPPMVRRAAMAPGGSGSGRAIEEMATSKTGLARPTPICRLDMGSASSGWPSRAVVDVGGGVHPIIFCCWQGHVAGAAASDRLGWPSARLVPPQKLQPLCCQHLTGPTGKLMILRWLHGAMLLMASCRSAPDQADGLRVTIDTTRSYPVTQSLGNAPIWSANLVYTLGGSEGPTEFGSIRSVLLSGDQSLYVADPSYVAVSVFDSTGRFVRQLGREGSGPGEYRDPYSLAWLGRGLALLDPGNSRIGLYEPSGGWATSWNVPRVSGGQFIRLYRTPPTF